MINDAATGIFHPLAEDLLESISLNCIPVLPTSIVQERVDSGKVDAAYPEHPQPDLVLVFPTKKNFGTFGTHSVSHVNRYKVSYHSLLKGKPRKIGGDYYVISCRQVGGTLGTADHEDDKFLLF